MFLVLVVQAVPDHLRGYLERFLQEVRTGVYVGTTSRRVADRLWEVTSQHAGPGDATMIQSSDSEAGYTITSRPHPRYSLLDYDGWTLAATLDTQADPQKPR